MRPAITRSALIAATTLGATAAAIWAAQPAGAHTGHGGNGLVDGVLHPLLGLDHLLAMVAVGVLASLTARKLAVWTLPVAFVGGMVAGGGLGIAGVPAPGAEVAIAASVALLGVAVAADGRIARGWLPAAVAVFGLAHGHAHGAEAPTTAHPALYVVGFVIVTIGLHLAGALGGIAVRRHTTARHALGAGLAAAGAALLAGTI
ncbi:MAG: HupE/UreJ family protein [Acidimicrobiales bacterium]|nr:HupE/UreJ family protein [Acidimicrobiales bacterium]